MRRIRARDVGGRPPLEPSRLARTTQTSQAPKPDSPMSRTTDHRRENRASAAVTTMRPAEASHQMTVTTHRMPSGAEAIVVATVCSAEELARVTTQPITTARTARPRRTASLPRRRVWPSPTGAKRTALQVRPRDRRGDPAGAPSASGTTSGVAPAGWTVTARSTPSDRMAFSPWCTPSIAARTLRPGPTPSGHACGRTGPAVGTLSIRAPGGYHGPGSHSPKGG